MRTFRLRILAAERTFYDGPCQSLMVPTIDGLYGLMALHENIVIAIIPVTVLVLVTSGHTTQALTRRKQSKKEAAANDTAAE